MKNTRSLIIATVSFAFVTAFVLAVFLYKKEEFLTDRNSVSVYFVKNPDDNNFELVTVKRKINPSSDKITTAVEELLKGPSLREKKQGYYTEIPQSARLLEIKKSPDKIILNLSEDFESGGGSTSMDMRLKQLMNTSLDASEGMPVYLNINGENINSIGGEGVIVPQPFSRDL